MFDPVMEYFRRAHWGLGNAQRDDVRPEFKGYLTAFAVHACQSLKETLDRIAAEPKCDPKFAEQVSKLPHRELIENIRNMDLHGWPMPIPDP